MPDAILVLNAGSSSTKLSLFLEQAGELVLDLRGKLEGLEGEGAPHLVVRRPDGAVVAERHWPENAYLGHAAALTQLLPVVRGALRDDVLAGVAHRVVHGGASFEAPVLVDDAVLARLQTFVPLAPLHQPHNLTPIRALRELESGTAAGGLLRHRIPSQHAGRGRALRAPRGAVRGGRPALRLPRHLLRVRRRGAPVARPRRRARTDRGDAPGKRRQPLRPARGRERRDDHGLQRARRPLHGDALRRARPRRRALARRRARARPPRYRAPPLRPVRAARRLGDLERHARPARLTRAPRAARRGPLRLPDRPRAGVAGGGARGARRRRLHRRYRRERGRDPRARLPRCRLARRGARPGGQRCRRPANQHRAEPGLGVGGPHRRGADDRAPRSHAAGATATHGKTGDSS